MINHVHKLGNVPVGGSNPVRIMGILNTSAESFYKKSIKTTKQSIINTIKQFELDGADFIDVGGMSTAPYLDTIVSEKTESDRIIKAIKIIQNHTNLPISVDTCRANVAKAALDEGVDIINDISGLQFDAEMPHVVERYDPSLILCAYSKKTVSGNHVIQTRNLLDKSIRLAIKSGADKTRLVVDPAIGFFRNSGKGKFFTKIKSDWVIRDLTILQNLYSIKQNYPLLVSVSNKSFIGKLLGKDDPKDRMYGTIAAEVISVLNGADIIRTHNVKQTREAITVTSKFQHKGL